MTFEEKQELWEECRWDALDLVKAKIEYGSFDEDEMRLILNVTMKDSPEEIWIEEMEEMYGD